MKNVGVCIISFFLLLVVQSCNKEGYNVTSPLKIVTSISQNSNLCFGVKDNFSYSFNKEFTAKRLLDKTPTLIAYFYPNGRSVLSLNTGFIYIM